MFKRLILSALIAFVPSAFAATHSVNLWWNASADSTSSNPGTTNVYRATAACPASGISGVTFTKISSGQNPGYPQAAPYADNSVTVGNTYCYYVTAVFGGAESAPSNTFQPSTIAPASPTALAGVVQ